MWPSHYTRTVKNYKASKQTSVRIETNLITTDNSKRRWQPELESELECPRDQEYLRDFKQNTKIAMQNVSKNEVTFYFFTRWAQLEV